MLYLSEHRGAVSFRQTLKPPVATIAFHELQMNTQLE
jgi:hypothetical protein